MRKPKVKLHAKPRLGTVNERLNHSLCGKVTNSYALDPWVTCKQCLKKLMSLQVKDRFRKEARYTKSSTND